MTHDDLFDIRCLLSKLIKSRLKIILCTSCGILLFLGASFLMTPKYEASTLMKSGTSVIAGAIVTIEDVPSLIARLRSPVTLENILRVSGKEINRQNIKYLLSNSRFTELGSSLQLKVLDSNYDGAIACVNHYVDEIIKQEEIISNEDLACYKSSLEIAIQQKKQLMDMIGESDRQGKSSENIYARELILNTLIQKDSEIRQIRQYLSPPWTTKAHVIIPVTCFPWPVFPNRLLFSVLGAFLGIAVSLAWIFHYPSYENE